MTPMCRRRSSRSPRPVVRDVLVIAGTIVSLAAIPAMADVANTPAPMSVDSSTLQSLRLSLVKGRPVRVIGTFERFELTGVEVEPAGLRYDEAFRFRADPATLPASPIPWSRIERIETAQTNLGKGLVIGALVGLASGFLWNAANPPRGEAAFLKWGPTAAGVSLGRTIGATAAGTVLGAVIGSSMKKWETVYSEDSAEPAPR